VITARRAYVPIALASRRTTRHPGSVSWDWLIFGAVLVWLLLRSLRVPEQPSAKWAIFPAFGVLVVGTWAVPAGQQAVGITLMVVGGLGIVAWGLWDWFWRSDNGYSTVW